MFFVLGTRTTPIDDAELLALPVPGSTVTLFRREDYPGAGMDVVRDDAKVSISLMPVEEHDLRRLAPAAAAAVRGSQAPTAGILDRGHPELARDVAVALGRLLRGGIRDPYGLLGRPGRIWPPDEAAARPVRKAPDHIRGRDHAFVFVVPTQPQADLACWGDLTRQLPEALEVVPGAGGMLTGPDDVLLGIASIVRDGADVRVEIRDPSLLGMLMSNEQRNDLVFRHAVERATSHGAPIVGVSWCRDVPGEEAIAWGVLALVMERWGGVAMTRRGREPPPFALPATPEAARAESKRLDPDLDWTPAPPPRPPAVRWASTGGIVLDEPVVIPPHPIRGEPPKPVFIARMRVFPTRHVLFTTEGLTEALGVVVRHGSLGPTRGNLPWIATLERAGQGVMFVQPPLAHQVEDLRYATFDDATRARVEHLLTAAKPLGCGPSILEVHVDLIDPLHVAIAYEVAAHLAELTEGVVAADHPMLLPRAGRTYTAAELRAMTEVRH